MELSAARYAMCTLVEVVRLFDASVDLPPNAGSSGDDATRDPVPSRSYVESTQKLGVVPVTQLERPFRGTCVDRLASAVPDWEALPSETNERCHHHRRGQLDSPQAVPRRIGLIARIHNVNVGPNFTNLNLAPLGCEYVAREPLPEWTRRPELVVTADGRAVVNGPREAVEDASAFVDALSGARSAAARAFIISDFLAASFTQPRDAPLSLYFNGQPIYIPTHGVFSFEDAISPLTFIDLKGLRSIRRQCLRRKWVQTASGPHHIPLSITEKNDPIVGLITKRLRQLQPAIESEDPYIVAVLIALAQRQCHERDQARPNTPLDNCNRAAELEPHAAVEIDAPDSVFETQEPFEACRHTSRENFKALTKSQVHLLALAASRTFCVYKARFPHSFLERFNNPSKFSPSGPISVLYYPLPQLDPKWLRTELYRNIHI
ncbi:hypothetical protein Purlil1_13130 [Purpureocillium lilacinum]|uniref:Uncharacterized protein n=1 Tax=Purpureocillium lilacinum TaxID=33203 RepID=A0ABR0BEZ0_PURLI|nr:hypothetical protein Purlil1_13130 [Purpureocillium lilacinum]